MLHGIGDVVERHRAVRKCHGMADWLLWLLWPEDHHSRGNEKKRDDR